MGLAVSFSCNTKADAQGLHRRGSGSTLREPQYFMMLILEQVGTTEWKTSGHLKVGPRKIEHEKDEEHVTCNQVPVFTCLCYIYMFPLFPNAGRDFYVCMEICRTCSLHITGSNPPHSITASLMQTASKFPCKSWSGQVSST